MRRLLTAFLLVILIGCDDEISITAPGDLLTLRTEPALTTLPADGRSRATLVATIIPPSASSRRTIVFTTTSGTLIGGNTANEVAANERGEASIQLQSAAAPDTAIVTARSKEVPNAAAQATVQFIAAGADSLSVTSDKFALKQGFAESAKIQVQLRRQSGTPSIGIAVTFRATDDRGNPIGQFASPTIFTAAAGAAETQYTAGATNYLGPVSITAMTSDGISGSTTVTIIP